MHRAAGDSGGIVSSAPEEQGVKCQLCINNAGYPNNGGGESPALGSSLDTIKLQIVCSK